MVAQVGVNNQNPTASLDVIGDVLVQEKLYLENPGIYTGEANAKLLVIKDSDNAVVIYDVANSSYGLLNYVKFIIKGVSYDGLKGGFNTKIDASKYTIAVHGFSFDKEGDTNVFLRSTGPNGSQYVEGHQFYAYVSGNTWWLKGLVNNSQFRSGVNNNTTNVDITMDVIIYRNDFVTKIWKTTQSIDMGREPEGTVPLPVGF